MSKLRTVVADDHGLVRAGIRALIETFPDFEVVAEAANGREALSLIAELDPDVALVNITTPELDGFEVSARAKAEHPRTRTVLFSLAADGESLRRALLAGAAGYLIRGADGAELELALRTAARGEVWLSPSVSRTVVAAITESAAPPARASDVLTARQREILQLVAEGQSTKEIAANLGVTPKTVESHRAQLMHRLGIRGLPALVRAALRLGLIQAED